VNRKVLGILNYHGTFAEYLALPVVNLHVVPASVPTEAAAFVEPLAAACRIVEQGLIRKEHKVCVVGDGKLGLLIAEVIARQNLEARPVLYGRHKAKMALLHDLVDARELARGSVDLPADVQGAFDVVVDATGTPEGLKQAGSLVAPMGTIVLKSTCASPATIDTAPFVVREINIVGSRCGPFPDAMELVASSGLDVCKYVSAVYPLDSALEAFEKAKSKGCLKVQLAIASSELSAIGMRPDAE